MVHFPPWLATIKLYRFNKINIYRETASLTSKTSC